MSKTPSYPRKDEKLVEEVELEIEDKASLNTESPFLIGF